MVSNKWKKENLPLKRHKVMINAQISAPSNERWGLSNARKIDVYGVILVQIVLDPEEGKHVMQGFQLFLFFDYPKSGTRDLTSCSDSSTFAQSILRQERISRPDTRRHGSKD